MSRPLRVLIVEDSENDTALLKLELQRAGYDPQCRQVQTAEQMQAALQSQPWDLVIADYRMPRFDGLSALALVKEPGSGPAFHHRLRPYHGRDRRGRHESRRP